MWICFYLRNNNGGSVNATQIDIKSKTCNIQTWEKHSFQDVFSTNIDTLVPSLYHVPRHPHQRSLLCCLNHFRTSSYYRILTMVYNFQKYRVRKLNISDTFVLPFQILCYHRNICHPFVNIFKRQTLLYEYPLHWVLLPTKKRTTERCHSVVYSQAWSPFWLRIQVSENVHAHLLPKLSRSWNMLLPSDTYRKPLTSITAVLHQFVTYLLTFLLNWSQESLLLL
jgi:hypothetical protein